MFASYVQRLTFASVDASVHLHFKISARFISLGGYRQADECHEKDEVQLHVADVCQYATCNSTNIWKWRIWWDGNLGQQDGPDFWGYQVLWG